MKIASSNLLSIADQNRMKVNPITVDDDFLPSKNLDISQLELMLLHNSTKYYKFIQNHILELNCFKRDVPVDEVDLLAVRKDNSDIQHMIRFLKGEETLNHSVNLIVHFPQKLHKHMKRLEVNNGVLYRQLSSIIRVTIRTLHSNPMQGHPGSNKKLYELPKLYYPTNLAIKVRETINGCKLCAQSKPVNNAKLKSPLQKTVTRTRGPHGN